MKKLLAIALALVLICALSVTALADDNVFDPDHPDDKKTTVNFNVTPSYTVTIPQSVVLETDPYNKNEHIGYATISAQNVHLKKGEVLRVKVTSNFKLTTKAQYNPSMTYDFGYVIKVGEKTSTWTIDGTSTEDQLIVANFSPYNPDDPNDTVSKLSQKLTFVATGIPVYAGRYEGTVTFTISVYDPNFVPPRDDNDNIQIPESGN